MRPRQDEFWTHYMAEHADEITPDSDPEEEEGDGANDTDASSESVERAVDKSYTMIFSPHGRRDKHTQIARVGDSTTMVFSPS